MVKSMLLLAMHIVAYLLVALTGSGCAANRLGRDIVAVEYKEPRPWGFGWNIVVLHDGLAMFQVNAEAIEYARFSDKTTDNIFKLAQTITALRDSMANVVDAQNGMVEVHTNTGIIWAAWDEIIMPDYGFTLTSQTQTRRLEQASEFVLAWTRLKTELAGALATAPRNGRPLHLDTRSEQLLRTEESHWEDSRPWWSELMERAHAARWHARDEDQ